MTDDLLTLTEEGWPPHAAQAAADAAQGLNPDVDHGTPDPEGVDLSADELPADGLDLFGGEPDELADPDASLDDYDDPDAPMIEPGELDELDRLT